VRETRERKRHSKGSRRAGLRRGAVAAAAVAALAMSAPAAVAATDSADISPPGVGYESDKLRMTSHRIIRSRNWRNLGWHRLCVLAGTKMRQFPDVDGSLRGGGGGRGRFGGPKAGHGHSTNVDVTHDDIGMLVDLRPNTGFNSDGKRHWIVRAYNYASTRGRNNRWARVQCYD